MSEITSISGVVDQLTEKLHATSDDTTYHPEYLYAVLLQNRNLLLYRELNKNKYISKHLYKSFCMPLDKSKNIPCECLPDYIGCTVLKARYPFPKPVKSSLFEYVHVMTLDGRIEFSQRELRVGKYNKYRRINASKPYYTIYNNYLYLIGVPNNDLKAVLIEMVLEDPSEADEISLCDNTGTEVGGTCFDPLTDSFQIDGHLLAPLIDMSFQQISPSLSLPEDSTNDTLSIPDNKRI